MQMRVKSKEVIYMVLKIQEWGGKNKEGNKAFVRNNEWESQMSPSHPPT
jgi:hypothetical protein